MKQKFINWITEEDEYDGVSILEGLMLMVIFTLLDIEYK